MKLESNSTLGFELSRQEAYWRRTLGGELPILHLCLDNPRPPVCSFIRATESVDLASDICSEIKNLCARQNVTVFVTLLAAFKTLLFRHTGVDDIIVGSVSSDSTLRTEDKQEKFINPVALRTSLEGDPTFARLLKRVAETVQDASTNRNWPFERIVEDIQKQSRLSDSSVFKFMFVAVNSLSSVSAEPVTEENLASVGEYVAGCDLVFLISEQKEVFTVTCEYDAELFNDAPIARFLRQYETLLAGVAGNSDQRISVLPILTEPEKHQLLVEWNDTGRNYPSDKCVHQLFEDQVEQTPDVIAIVYEGQELTYRELNQRANQLAHYLMQLGVGPELLVGIFMERSLDMVVAVLGILKAGGAYVPLDPGYPTERLAFILNDTQASIVLTQQGLVDSLPKHTARFVCGPSEWQEIQKNDTNPVGNVVAANLAYVIYTSGSTGKPKGVAIQHSSPVAFLSWVHTIFSPEQLSGVLASTSICFDLSVFELLAPLTRGGQVILVDNALALPRLPTKSEVTLINTVPSAIAELVQLNGIPPSVVTVNLAGEPLSTGLVQQIYATTSVKHVYDLYGPSEDTTYSTAALRTREGPKTIGRPISNTQIYILDGNLNPVPVGVSGELHIGGKGLARGYLNQPDLTAERFIPNPFSSEPATCLYRTGDLARYLPDGKIEFLGRIDHQIKLRGFRIELGEIEAVLANHDGVADTVVLAREDVAGDKRLVAYIVSNKEDTPTTQDLRNYLKQKLPDYMVPSAFVYLDALPRTPNGKVDRKTLPPPDQTSIGLAESYVAPRGPLEEILVGIWVDVLKLEHVGVHDNFFELGGHSLLATQVIARLRTAVQIELPLRALFERPTIAGLAKAVEESQCETKKLTRLSITAISRDGDLPPSFAQARLWFLDQLEPNSCVYNLANAIRLTGKLSAAALERSINEIVRRQEALRTRFSMVEGQLIQVISSSLTLPVPLLDLSNLSEADREAEAQRLAVEEGQRPFDLARGPLLRSKLVQLGYDDHVLFVTMHHIVSDGWSMGVFFDELSLLYEAISQGKPSPLPDLPIQYGDYAVWQREWLQGEVLETQLSYWKNQLANVQTLQLPTDRPRPPVQSYRGASQSMVLSAELQEALKTLSRQQGVTLFMTLLAAFQTLLYRYTGQDDIAVGSPIAGRNRTEIEGLIGFFVNTLVLRSDLSGDPRFRELLGRVRKVALDAYAHQDLPFEKLVEELQPQRNLSHSPLFQVMFVFQNAPATTLEIQGLSVSPMDSRNDTAKFDLILSTREESGSLRADLQYNTDLFDGPTIDRMLSHFENLLKEIVADPDRRLSDFPLLTQLERHQLLVEWNNTKGDHPDDKCVHQLFEEQVERIPDAVAVVFESRELTYRELNQRANQLAHYLIRLGVGPEQLVGVFMERSLEMVVAVLGILKSGAAYVPIDHESPKERLAFFLQDTKASVLVTQEPLLKYPPSSAAQLVCLDPCWITIRQERVENPTVEATPTRLAYVTYTSGSTGQPKGVMIEHRSLVNYLRWVNSGLLNDDIGTVPMITDLSFDACLKQLFAPLLCGKQVWLVPRDLVIQPAALLQEIRRKGRVGLNCVPSVWAAMLNEIDSVQAMPLARILTSLFLGGERIGEELVGKSFAAIPALEVWNLYGPTETTANASYGKVVSSHKVTIGKPIANTEIFLLDNRLQPIPIGVIGEIYIGGAGLARGYLNCPELTAEKFIASPFGSLPGARLYRTGDLARYLSDGSIELIGRIDYQVKIRGFRVELGEIESTLRQHPSVREAVVLAREDDPHEKRLVAYIVSSQSPAPSHDNLRSFLKQKLPEYMLPTLFVFLDSVPLLANGKMDRRALPPPDQRRLDSAEGFVAPRTSVEELLAGIWAEILHLERVGIHDNFFELGGHSLLAMQVIARLRKAMQIGLPVRALFESPTIAGLAKDVEASQPTTQKITDLPIAVISRDGDLPLSFAQARLWFLDQLEPNSSLYNLANGIRLRGRLNVAALEQSLNEIVRRHEALRTRFLMVQGQPTQVISSSLILPLPISDFTHLSSAEREAAAQRFADEESQRPFDLAREPLLRSRLARLSDDDHVLLVTMHHIVSDGWSMGVFFRELSALYEAFSSGKPSPLPDLLIQYADYAVWQRDWLTGEELDRQLAYWSRQLAGAPAVLHLPADRPRPPIQTFRGARQPVSIPKSLSEALTALSHREGVTLFMTLLAAFKVLLSRYTGETDIVVGTPIAGRTHSKSEELIGLFANTLVLRTDLSGDPIFRTLLKRVKEIALEAYAHQELPFEKLVELLQPERDLSYNPLFQILFALNNTRTPLLELPGLTLSRVQLDSGTARFDLALDLSESSDGLIGSLEYNTDLFEAATISRMAGQFETLLETIVSDPSRRLSTLSLLTEAERRKLLVEWNGRPITQGHDLCLHEMFEAQVERMSDSVAVVCEGNRLTYRELNRRANQLAHYLRKLGVKPEVPVGICVERSVEMLVGLLAILKAGGAYVPLDPAYPAERLAFMLDDIQAPVLLTQRDILERLPRQQNKVICLDTDWEIIAEESEENLSIRMTPENLAYVIYTSGSTGRPKGVQVCHRSVFRLLEATRPLFGFDEHDVWTVFHSYAFDFSVWEIWGALLQGGRLVVVPLQVAQSPAAFRDLLRAERVTVLNQTPSAIRQLVEASPKGPKKGDYWSLRLIICGGEAFPRDLASRLMEWDVSVRNFYGPTEATVWSTINPITLTGSEGESIPIGRPIADRQIYLLDENLQPVPIGVPGELHIGGAGLARGYFKRPELTAERLIPDPFSNDPGARLYRTGDWARYLPDGCIEFLGRIDHQVKIRGFRVELGEVESVLGQHPSVRETVVTTFAESTREKELVAYVISKQEHAPTIHELHSFLKDKLPDYMMPSAFVFLDSLPLTPNGKVNRGSLPAPDRNRAALWQSYVAARTPIEEKLAEIWGEVLRLERVGIYDNFFDLGGHSLKATQVVSQLREVFQVEMPLRNLFEHPTVAGLAESLEAIWWASNQPQLLDAHTTTAEFLSSLRTQDIQLCAEGAKLDYIAPPSALTSELDGEPRKRKAEIVELLHEASNIAPPILPVSRDGNLPLSFAQERLWFLDQLEPANPSYNIPAALRLTGCLDLSALEQALNEVLTRHEGLRTTFVAIDGQPFQVIAPIAEWTLPIVDVPSLPEGERENEIQRLVNEEASRPFNLARGPLFRVCVVRVDDTQHVLLITMHHIVSDGWSMEVFFEELSVLYDAFLARKASPLPALAVHYADFAVWQRRWFQGNVLENQLSYWKHQLSGAPPVLELPHDNPRPVVQTFRGARVGLVLPRSLSSALKDLSHRESASLFMTLLAAFKLLLHRYTGEEDLVVGSPIAGRNRRETEKLIGFFLNTLVLRTDLSGNPSFRELLARVRVVALDAYAHQDIPFEKLLQELQPDRDLSRTPLFQVFFNMLTLDGQDRKLQGLMVTRVGHSEPHSKFDLTVYVRERGETIHLDFVYNADLFHGDRMKQMLEHFQTLLQGIVADPDQRLSDLPLMTDDLQRQLSARDNLVRSTEPFVEFEKEAIEQSIADRFEEQVKKYPDHVAVKTRTHQWTYSELNRTANQIAQTILQACRPGEQRVGLLFEHDAPMIAGILGVLKAGKTYVPLDPTFPAERLSYLLEDSQSAAVLTDRGNFALGQNLTNSGLQLINANEIDAEVSTRNPNSRTSPDTLAYILYTSGSTGMPKGVMQNNRNVLHHIRNYTNSLHLNSDDRLALFSSYGFDAAVMDIFGALLNGASLHPMDIKQEDPSALFHRVAGEKITVYHSTPTVYRYLTNALTGREDLSKIRFVVLGGEEVHREDIDLFKKIFSPHAIFVNGLGPSESTVTLQYFINHESEITGNIVPVGYAVEDTDVLLLNRAGKQGEVFGEIGIRSAHVALGYWRKPEMTKAVFLPDPQCGAKRIYHSGDLGRLLPDGSIAFVGRKDFQVKIRGFRIELGEIESALVEHPAVREAVAMVREDEPNDKRLVAYLIPEKERGAVATELREFLKKKLPDYMIPSVIMTLDALPLTPNGKVDRQALPRPDQSEETFVAPRTSIEEALARIWAEVLKLERVGIHDNFFYIGGHSLLATQVISRIRRDFQTEIPLRALFEKPTVEELAIAIMERQAEELQGAEQLPRVLGSI